ncbi:MAG: translocation/assembly module TamB domain-containing protein [Spirosomataceae bacterium]
MASFVVGLGFLVSLFAIQHPFVQTKLAHKATEWLTQKLGGTVEVGQVKVRWFDDISLQNVVIKDIKNRDMIEVKEIFVNFKTNFSFDKINLIRFDNNLDYITLYEPKMTLIRENDGSFNFDKWVAKVQYLINPNPVKRTKEHNIPFTVDEAYIQNGQVKLIDHRKKRFPKNEFDYRNFHIQEVHGNIKNFFIQGDTITFQGSQIKGVDKRSNLRLHELKTDFFYSRQQMLMKKLYARINDSEIRDFIGLYYREPVDFDDFNHLVKIRSNFADCQLQSQDLARFAPGLYPYQDTYLLNGYFDGTVDDFSVKNFELKFGKESYFVGNVGFKGMPYYLKSSMNLDFKSSRMVETDVAQYVGATTHNKHIKKWEDIQFEGWFKGTYRDFTTDFAFQSKGIGQAKGILQVRLEDNPAFSTYKGGVTVTNLALGRLTFQEEILDRISFTGDINGKGLTIQDATLQLDGLVSQFDFQQYNYQNIQINGKMGQSIFTGRVDIDDPNLVANVSGTVDFSRALNRFIINGSLQQAHLEPLGLSDEPISLRTSLNLDMDGNELNNWVGYANFWDTEFIQANKSLKIDSLLLFSENEGHQRRFSLSSEFFDAQIKGEYRPSDFIYALQYALEDFRPIFKRTSANEWISGQKLKISPIRLPATSRADYSVTFRNSAPFFTYFFPNWGISSGSTLQGEAVLGTTNSFTIQAKLDTLSIGNSLFLSSQLKGKIQKTIHQEAIYSSLDIQSQQQFFTNSITTEKLAFRADWMGKNLISFSGDIHQLNTTNSTTMVGTVDIAPDQYTLSFNSDQSFVDILNGRWQLPSNNQITYTPAGFQFNDVRLENQQQQVGIEGEISRQQGKVALISIDQFDLKTLQPIIKEKITGIISGKISLLNTYTQPQILSNLLISDLANDGYLIGNLAASSRYESNLDKLLLFASIENAGKDILLVNGTFDSQNERNPLDLEARLSGCQVNVFQPFVRDIFSKLEGNMNGKFVVQGTPKHPLLTGKVKITSGRMRIDALQADLYFNDEVELRPDGFFAHTDGFKVFDAPQNGNEAIISGGIIYPQKGPMRLDIHGLMRDRDGFTLLRTNSKDNADFYGIAHATGDIHVTGDFNNVLITGNLLSKRNTKLTIPLDTETSVNIEEETIPFVGKVQEKKEALSEQVKETVDFQPIINLNGLKMSLNISLTPEAECEIIFDRANNDRVLAYGNGRLTIDYDTRGGFSLTGPYTVKSGKYDFSFQNLASLRKFEITDGSKITWSGDPYNAQIEMDAAYVANVPLSEIPGISTSNTTEAANRYPVRVIVHLRDNLLVPQVGFSIEFDQRQIPVTYQSQILAFQQRLKDDEQLLSRNVSSILAFNQLFPDNIVDALRQQFLIDNLNNILSNQIGNLANKLDPNLELGVQLGDVRQNFNNAQLNISYKLLNDRIRLSGRSAYLNGDIAALNPQGQLTIGGEIDYMLTDDGTWRMKAYSRSLPNSSFFLSGQANGNVLVYGLSLQFSRNFNRIIRTKPTTNFPIGAN